LPLFASALVPPAQRAVDPVQFAVNRVIHVKEP
jgi:hypothetical protein